MAIADHSIRSVLGSSLIALALDVAGCGRKGDEGPAGNASDGASGAITGGGGSSGGGTATTGHSGTGGLQTSGGTVDPCAVPDPTVRSHPGTYDYESCAVCHPDMWGGWVYSNAVGEAWVPAATVTLNNTDGTAVSAPTAANGFFHLTGATTSTFTPCVSRCSDETCATRGHDSLDCQNANCHGSTGHLIYLTLSDSGSGGTGGSNPGDCIPPASGGPRMHDTSFDDQTCTTCHRPGYLGGYVYDGVVSRTPVPQATLTITPEGGTPLAAVTGPGGFFQILGDLAAPYQVCVSKCPDTVCALKTSHTTAADCSTCHTPALRIHLP
ncbi:MAG: hypothetical protein JW751_32000 [Polyangiaceae bacterium]|nr:hypothetical protein [Polyangiaceae bacterium]